MRAPLVAIVVANLGGAVCAQPASQDVQSLEACFQSARETDAVCSNPANDPARRLECIQQARTTLLQCMEQVGHGASAGAAASDVPTGTVPPATAAATTGAAAAPGAPAAPDKPTRAAAPEVPARVVETPVKQADAGWVVSETTSPVDYRPLITAVIRSTSGANSLALRCLGARTELLVRTEEAWHSSRSGEVQVAYQINDQPSVRLAWAQSPDGRTVSYKEDASNLLQSLPEAARLKISVFDGADSGRDASFQLNGLDAVRKKLGTVCKWTPANRISSGKP
jgi:Type VI secretion system VasI, EvfG, VC_A0118